MNAPRHLSRVLDEILSCASATLRDEDLVDERSTLCGFAEHLRRKSPEQIRPSSWEHAELLVREIAASLGEPDRGVVERIWTGARMKGSPADTFAVEALKSLEAIATGTAHDIVIYQALQRLSFWESREAE